MPSPKWHTLADWTLLLLRWASTCSVDTAAACPTCPLQEVLANIIAADALDTAHVRSWCDEPQSTSCHPAVR